MKWIPPNKKWTPPKTFCNTPKRTPPTTRKLVNKTPKWKPPPVKSTRDEPSITQEEPPGQQEELIINNLYYYPLYSGWLFPKNPFIFSTPSQAASWTISRFKTNGLSNIWGPGMYPDFLRFVGTINTDQSNLEISNFRTSRKPSQIEEHYFLEVVFYDIIDPTAIRDSSYMRLNDKLFLNIIATLKDTPDYFMSSTSIYRPKSLCVSSVPTDVYYRFSRFIYGKRSPTSLFIQLEQRVLFLKTNVYCSHGNHHVFSEF